MRNDAMHNFVMQDSAHAAQKTHEARVATASPLLDARVWVVWTAAVALLATLTRNPLYLLLILLAVRLVAVTWRQKTAVPETAVFPLPLGRLAAIMLTFSTLFNLLFVHVGSTVLLRLPTSWPLIGGVWTAEAAVYGAINGLMILTLLVIFLTFNQIVPGSELVHLTPRAFHNLGLVLLIALTYVPETRRHWQKIRDAQAIRGHQVRGWRDWRPILLPLLVGGMERALALAEAMVARGYGAAAPTRQPRWVQAGLLLGLGASFCGWMLSFWLGWPGWLLLGAGVLLLLAVVWKLGQNKAVHRYDQRSWTWRETAVTLSALLPLLLLIPWPGLDGALLAYTPYPQLGAPPFSLLAGGALLLLALPGALSRD